MSRLPEAFVTHQMAGRVRIKIPSCKNNQAYFTQLLSILTQLHGVTEVKANPQTASILLLGRFELARLTALAKEQGLFEIKQLPVNTKSKKSVAIRLKNTACAINKGLSKATDGAVDLPSIFSVSLLTMGAIQILSGNFGMPAWYTAFWYASDLLRKTDE